MTNSRPPRQRSFLLRCWEEQSDAENHSGVWRFSLEEVGGKRLGFPSIESLMRFLEQDLHSADSDAGVSARPGH